MGVEPMVIHGTQLSLAAVCDNLVRTTQHEYANEFHSDNAIHLYCMIHKDNVWFSVALSWPLASSKREPQKIILVKFWSQRKYMQCKYALNCFFLSQ